MDRPHRIDRLNAAGAGVFTVEGIHPSDLQDECDRVLEAFAASGLSSPYVSGITLDGGGDGATWRCSLTCAEALGPGEALQSIYAERAHVWFTQARNAPDIDRAKAVLLDAIEADYPTAYVFDVQIAGAGRDGSYMFAVLFSENEDSPPLINDFDGSNSGPQTDVYDAAQVVIPETVSGGPNDQAAYKIDWSVAVNRGVGAGSIEVMLWSDVAGAAVISYDVTPLNNTDYECFAGTYVTLQPVGADETFSIRIDPRGGTIQTEDASINASLVNRNGEPS